MVFFLIATFLTVSLESGKSGITLFGLAGRIMIIASCYTILYLFLSHFCAEVVKVTSKTLFIVSLVSLFVFVSWILINYQDNFYFSLVPFALLPVIIRNFQDSRLAVFVLLMTLIIIAFHVPDPFEFVFINFLTGMAAVFSMAISHRKGKFILAAVTVVFCYCFLHTGIKLMHDGNLTNLHLRNYLTFAGNGLLVLLCYPVVYIAEKKFKFLSDSTLLQLADTNQPLLRKLADEAPGSFQHSLQVANLGEEAARMTGANPLLVRAGALYHDIGKISGPDFYVENQKNGFSPHDSMDPRTSAKHIINHVSSGIILAKNFKLPPQIIDFIKTHHGTSVTYFFYKKYTDLKPCDVSSEKEFAYPGPKPFSKETAIVMMADAVEASSRSLSRQTEDSISELVERIILLQEQNGQYAEVPFTYKDISDIKEAFKRRLQTIYHGRIAYPEDTDPSLQ
jgi:putative nucleotidyltransferase with HDIG domain